MVYVVGKFIARSGIKGYNVILKSNMKNLVDDVDKTKDKRFTSTFKILNNAAYNVPHFV